MSNRMDLSFFLGYIGKEKIETAGRIYIVCQAELIDELAQKDFGKTFFLVVAEGLEQESRFISKIQRLSLGELEYSVYSGSEIQNLSSVPSNYDIIIIHRLEKNIIEVAKHLLRSKQHNGKNVYLFLRERCMKDVNSISKKLIWTSISEEWELSIGKTKGIKGWKKIERRKDFIDAYEEEGVEDYE